MPRPPEETFDAALSGSLATVAAGLGVALLGLTGAHALVLRGDARLVTVVAGVAGALVLGLAFLHHKHRPVPRHAAHAVAAGQLTVVLGVSATAVVATEDPPWTSTLMLLIVAAGVVLLSLRWVLAYLYLTWAVWVVAAALVGPSREWAQAAVGLAAATALALVVNRMRRTAAITAATAIADAEAAAVRDGLTGVSNRRGLALVGAQLVEQARRQGDAVHCIFVDIDGLKSVNEALGHDAGDRVLAAVAVALAEVTRATDVVARWGGDEFCVVGPGPGMPPLELERRVRDSVAASAPVPEAVWPARVTAGGAMLEPWDAGSLETLLGNADRELGLRRSLRRDAAARSARRADQRPLPPD